MININKHYQQTTGLIQRLINIAHLSSICVVLAKKFCLRKCVYCVRVSLARKTISNKQEYVQNGFPFVCKQARDDVTKEFPVLKFLVLKSRHPLLS